MFLRLNIGLPPYFRDSPALKNPGAFMQCHLIRFVLAAFKFRFDFIKQS